MKNNKSKNKLLKTYKLIGTYLLALSGAIVGFITAGPLLAVVGIAIGFCGGKALEKILVRAPL